MKVCEIFQSISGEIAAVPQGTFSTFVRFSKCNLRCSFCDAQETQNGSIGEEFTPEDLTLKILSFSAYGHIILTGGEPLIQTLHEITELIYTLYNAKKIISIETNGSISIPEELIAYATWVVDFKIDQADKMDTGNALKLGPKDYIKFVIQDFPQLDWAIAQHKKYLKEGVKATFAYSPVLPGQKENYQNQNLSIAQNFYPLVNQIFNKLNSEGFEAIINTQVHKFLGLK